MPLKCINATDMMPFKEYFHPPAIAAAFVSVLVGYTSSAVITFLVTASGINLFGIGAAFWGLVAGVTTLFVLAKK